MYIQVRLLNGFKRPLWYKIPQQLRHLVACDLVVQVPLRNQMVPAIIVHQTSYAPAASFEIKEINALEPFPNDAHYLPFITQMSYYYQLDKMNIIKRIAHFLAEKEKADDFVLPLDELQSTQSTSTLTVEQQAVCDFLKPHIATPTYKPTVLHGVTGSGKTEVYKQLILEAYANNKTTVLLLPEVTLAATFEKRLKHELANNLTIYGFHSGSSPKEKRALWQALVTQKPALIIGVHLPILLPIGNLGLIIIDEEHEPGYQEKKHPKINSKEAALLRAQQQKIPIVLGSATPTVATLYNVKKRGWHLFQLKNRFAGSFPIVETVLLTDKKERKNFWISKRLYDEIKVRLAKKEQIIIFINRRGFSFFVQCKECSFVFTCTSCSVSLTLHANNKLACHYCGHHMQQPASCPGCQKNNFIKKGVGTQQVATILEQLFPTARIGRADLDVTTKKKEWHNILHGFHAGTIDILVGTQTITKGHDFRNVTLVGILWADLNLNFPMYNAAETTLQQLIQVAGRAGRQSKENSLVIVQTMSKHPVFSYVNELDYLEFCKQELEKRAALGYPPCNRLIEIELKHVDEEIVDSEATMVSTWLNDYQDKHKGTLQILGPAKPPVHKIMNTFMRKIYIKGATMQEIIALYHTIDHRRHKSSIFFVPNPIK